MYKFNTFMFLAIALLLPLQSAFARPVSYAGGISPMTMNNGDLNALSIFYSPSARYAVGVTAEYWREDVYSLQTIGLNVLLRRWNNPESQGNLYIQSGLGAAYSDSGAFNHELEPAAYTGLAADWENRRFFASYENRFTNAGDIDHGFMQSGRVGITPYIGEYGDLHTWLMLEVRHIPKANDSLVVTPLVRVFKGTHLLEAGYSNQGDLTFNWMIQF